MEDKLKTTVEKLLEAWDENDPGPGNSWDDCCTDIKAFIEKLREVLES